MIYAHQMGHNIMQRTPHTNASRWCSQIKAATHNRCSLRLQQATGDNTENMRELRSTTALTSHLLRPRVGRPGVKRRQVAQHEAPDCLLRLVGRERFLRRRGAMHQISGHAARRAEPCCSCARDNLARRAPAANPAALCCSNPPAARCSRLPRKNRRTSSSNYPLSASAAMTLALPPPSSRWPAMWQPACEPGVAKTPRLSVARGRPLLSRPHHRPK